MHYALRTYISQDNKLPREERRALAAQRVRGKLQSDFIADAVPFLQDLAPKSDGREFLKALWNIAMLTPGATLPSPTTNQLQRLLMLAKAGLVYSVNEKMQEGVDGKLQPVKSLRLGGYYATLVLEWVDQEGNVRDEPLLRREGVRNGGRGGLLA